MTHTRAGWLVNLSLGVLYIAAFNAHMDDIDRYSKGFQNYQLDWSQIQDNDLNARGTASNGLAEALVKADPNRFQYVQTQDFLKGVDY